MNNNECIMTVKEIINATGGKLFGNKNLLNKKITGVSINSKEIKKGQLFIPFKGKNVDAHDYIEDAFNNGALISFSEKELSTKECPYIFVENTAKALKDLATYYRQTLSIPIIAVSGSVGKTSTKEMIASGLSEEYKVLKTIGNLNNEIGVPLTILSIKPNSEVAVIETGINHFGEMDILGEITKPDIAVLTNIADCHLENLNDRAGVYKAKSELFNHMKDSNSIIILNGDDGILGQVQQIDNYKIIKYGIHNENDIYAYNIKELAGTGTSGVIHVGNNSFDFKLKVPGIHNIYNMLCAVAVGSILNVDTKKILKGVEKNKPLQGHGMIIKNKKFTIYDESYNANPASMHACLNTLEHSKGRKVAILGDMGELGEIEKDLHKQLGRFIATKDIDILICIGDLSRHIIYGLEQAITHSDNKIMYYHFETKDDFYNELNNIIKTDDNILVKSSHFMKFNEIIDKLNSL